MTEDKYISPAKDEWYILLIEDLRDIVVERTFNASWEKILGKHEIGKRIFQEYPNFERKYIYGKDIASTVAKSLNCSTRDINRCIKFAKKYPHLNFLPAGKNISWNKIIKEYLPDKSNSKGEENDENKSNSGGQIKQIDNSGNETTGYCIPFSSPDEYKAWVQTQPCCVCGRKPAVFAHFPVTKARKDEHWGIPLCVECHTEQGQDDLNFFWNYRRKWAEFLFGLIFDAK